MHRIITLGLHHDHVWSNLEELAATGRAELAGAADTDVELLGKYRDRFPARRRSPMMTCFPTTDSPPPMSSEATS